MTNDERGDVYRVEPADDRFAVVGPSDQVVCRCATREQAEHYASLLKQGYAVGYKAGYRAGRS